MSVDGRLPDLALSRLAISKRSRVQPGGPRIHCESAQPFGKNHSAGFGAQQVIPL
jgi:hypothetical protein